MVFKQRSYQYGAACIIQMVLQFLKLDSTKWY